LFERVVTTRVVAFVNHKQVYSFESFQNQKRRFNGLQQSTQHSQSTYKAVIQYVHKYLTGQDQDLGLVEYLLPNVIIPVVNVFAVDIRITVIAADFQASEFANGLGLLMHKWHIVDNEKCQFAAFGIRRAYCIGQLIDQFYSNIRLAATGLQAYYRVSSHAFVEQL
jgi:hypothetical protein